MSHDHRFVAFTLDDSGCENFQAYVKDMLTGNFVLEFDNVQNIEWGNTSDPYVVYYTYVIYGFATNPRPDVEWYRYAPTTHQHFVLVIQSSLDESLRPNTVHRCLFEVDDDGLVRLAF